MNKKTKQVRISAEAYEKMEKVKEKTKVPIIHQIDKAILGK